MSAKQIASVILRCHAMAAYSRGDHCWGNLCAAQANRLIEESKR